MKSKEKQTDKKDILETKTKKNNIYYIKMFKIKVNKFKINKLKIRSQYFFYKNQT